VNLPRSIPAAGLLAPRSARTTKSGPLLPAPAARLVGFAALASFGALQWGRLVAPGAGGAMALALVASLLAGAALVQIARARPSARLRWAAGAGAAAILLVVALLGAGLPVRLLLPRGWDELVAGIAEALSAVPSITVPYRGTEQWTRDILVIGGGALIGLAAVLAFAPRRDGRFGHPVAAAVALGTLYAAPAIQRHADSPFISGLAFALLLALFLWLERIERRNAVLAAAIVAAAAVAGLAAAPQLDASRALLDYEELAQSLSGTSTTQYSWNHSYGPLDWPRDGREVLRVRSPQRAYWKAVNLTSFDGLRWIEDGTRPGNSADVRRAADPGWVGTMTVTIRALRSKEFIAAGTTLRIQDSRRSPVLTAPGTLATGGRSLARGERYDAVVYVPRPSARQMGNAGTTYPDRLHGDYGFLEVPSSQPRLGPDEQTVPIAFWGDDPAPQDVAVAGALAGTRYAGVYALALRLKAQSSSPYEYMRAIERYLVRGFSYSETPPASRVPLADFLLRDKVGYCQQFSGAMALLLRMGGVPARVSAGFAPGAVDTKTKEYIVRDIDAHSWVEVYFPRLGWVTRDPTPAASPARAQTADLVTTTQASDATIGGGGAPALSAPGDRGGAAVAATPEGGGGSSTGLHIASGAGILALLVAALVVVLRRRRRGPASPDDDLAELRRALRRSGRDPQPGLTLDGLASRMSGTPAEAYFRTLAAARYGYESARPTPGQRAALRQELAAGLGLRGRLRAWWALPPRPSPTRVRS